MQDRWVGDVGDFPKFGLLRWLTGMTGPAMEKPLRLGVVWYRRPSEPSNGGIIGYLSRTPDNHEKFHSCDPYLYGALKGLVFGDKRLLWAIEHSVILPANTIYYDECLSYDDLGNRQVAKKERRKEWLTCARKAVEEAAIVFVDPDNGMAVNPVTVRAESGGIAKVVSPFKKDATKYVFLDDLKCLAKGGQSLVIYHHLPRKPHTEVIRFWAKNLRAEFPESRIWALLHRHRGVGRVYFIVVQSSHKKTIELRLESFKQCSLWCTAKTPNFSVELKP